MGGAVERDGEADEGPGGADARGAEVSAAIAEAALDVPVLVRAEVGAVTLSAREWAELGPGDVLALGQPLKGVVTLRIDGVAVAKGELVDVDGELGVRIHAGGSPSMARR